MRDFTELGRTLLISGLMLAALGALLMLSKRLSWPRLPGDIVVERENFRFYMPLGTCLLASLVLSGVAWLFNRWR